MQVLVNLYSAHMDSDDWNQPQQFRPERFLDQSGNVVDRDRVIAFSLGSVYSLYARWLLTIYWNKQQLNGHYHAAQMHSI